MQIELKVSVPSGFTATGEYRVAEAGELYLGTRGNAVELRVPQTSVPVIILEKAKLWRLPHSFDVGKDCLVKLHPGSDWQEATLLAILDDEFAGDFPYICCLKSGQRPMGWTYCEVY